jgi:hypothetical protein
METLSNRALHAEQTTGTQLTALHATKAIWQLQGRSSAGPIDVAVWYNRSPTVESRFPLS